jgi:hypothetical protein
MSLTDVLSALGPADPPLLMTQHVVNRIRNRLVNVYVFSILAKDLIASGYIPIGWLNALRKQFGRVTLNHSIV